MRNKCRAGLAKSSTGVKRWYCFSILALLLVELTSCAPKQVASAPQAAPFASAELLSGFYPPEGEGWRWVARSFSVALTPPTNLARSNGARLTVRLFIPEDEIRAVGPLTLNASIDGQDLGPETFTKGGSNEFTRDLSLEVADTNLLPIQFCFDKAAPPVADRRELAAVVSGITLVARQTP